jgi:hypothetical protein
MSKLKIEKAKILWKDRKRVLGLPLSFTRYEVSDDRLITRKGFFSTETDEILLYRILDIKLTRSAGQKLFGVGTIHLYNADQTNSSLDIVNIKKPDKIRRFLSKQIEDQRISKGIAGREISGAGYDHHQHENNGDHDHAHDVPAESLTDD